jgi:hypothetical protein
MNAVFMVVAKKMVLVYVIWGIQVTIVLNHIVLMNAIIMGNVLTDDAIVKINLQVLTALINHVLLIVMIMAYVD